MTTLREAAQQALEALEAFLSDELRPYEAAKTSDALRAALAQQAEPVLQTCNCRWDGEVQVQQCTLHEAHIDAIHEWAERAKAAERKLAQQAEPVQDSGFWGRVAARQASRIKQLETAAQQALDWLYDNDILHPTKVSEDLRAALAQRAESLNLADPAVQKRLATQWGYVPAAQAEPVEPVAWMYDCGGGGRMYAEVLDGVPGWTPLYTAPPQRKPLTEEVAALTAQRDALLEALKLARPYISVRTMAGYHVEVKADAAIKAVEETK